MLFLLALAVGWQAQRLPFGTVSAPDSGFFPLSLAVALAILSALIALSPWVAGTGDSTPPTWQGVVRVALAAVALVGYVALLNWLGYLLASALLLLLYMRGLERVTWSVSLATTVVAVTVSYLLFQRLGVPLPAGILPL